VDVQLQAAKYISTPCMVLLKHLDPGKYELQPLDAAAVRLPCLQDTMNRGLVDRSEAYPMALVPVSGPVFIVLGVGRAFAALFADEPHRGRPVIDLHALPFAQGFERLDIPGYRSVQLRFEGMPGRGSQQGEDVEHRVFLTVGYAMPDGGAVIQNDIAIPVPRGRERDGEDSRPHGINAARPYDLCVLLGIQANRGDAEIAVDRGIARLDRKSQQVPDAACQKKGSVPFSICAISRQCLSK